MAKNKAQSWYRSFSLRKKSRPVIDPIDEEPEQLVQQNGQAHGDETLSGANELYRTQPEPPMSWYQAARPVSEVKSQKSRANTTKGPGHSMMALMEDGRPGERVSRASTRLSQLDMISSAPRGYQGEAASISNQSNVKKLAQKLSIIKEDSQSRGVTPLTEQPYPISMGGPIPPFVLPPQSDTVRRCILLFLAFTKRFVPIAGPLQKTSFTDFGSKSPWVCSQRSICARELPPFPKWRPLRHAAATTTSTRAHTFSTNCHPFIEAFWRYWHQHTTCCRFPLIRSSSSRKVANHFADCRFGTPSNDSSAFHWESFDSQLCLATACGPPAYTAA